MFDRSDSHVALTALAAVLLLVPGSAHADGASVTQAKTQSYDAYLADGEGMSLYLFEADEGGKSTCYDACAKAWPPLTTDGKPKAGAGVDGSLLGMVERDDGTMQVTYDGWPLYVFVKDKKMGDTKGQDVEGFGAEWYLVASNGGPVEDNAHESEESEEGGS